MKTKRIAAFLLFVLLCVSAGSAFGTDFFGIDGMYDEINNRVNPYAFTQYGYLVWFQAAEKTPGGSQLCQVELQDLENAYTVTCTLLEEGYHVVEKNDSETYSDDFLLIWDGNTLIEKVADGEEYKEINRFEYDSQNRLVSIVDCEAVETNVLYDENGNLAQITTYEALYTFSYEGGRLSSGMIAEAGDAQKSEAYFDITYADGGAAILCREEGLKLILSLNGEGMPLSVQHYNLYPSQDEEDDDEEELDCEESVTYDEQGRVTRREFRGADAQAQAIITYTYTEVTPDGTPMVP